MEAPPACRAGRSLGTNGQLPWTGQDNDGGSGGAGPPQEALRLFAVGCGAAALSPFRPNSGSLAVFLIIPLEPSHPLPRNYTFRTTKI
jgi:hypothetical protein